ncbi:MAG: hypothetical protein N2235_11635 [Fischerella sp.]|nr:hypothetical protein [Fischerella sp.]
MLSDFLEYSDIVLSAFQFNPKGKELVNKKKEIFDQISKVHNRELTNILFVGFSPLILAAAAKQIYVTEISVEAQKFLQNSGISFTYIDDLASWTNKIQCVIAPEEYFTFAKTDQEQKDKVLSLSKVTESILITTLRDYKNQDFKDREFSIPSLIRNGKQCKVILEFHNQDLTDRSQWVTTVFEMDPDGDQIVHGPYNRRAMYFKQLAKFSLDAGALDFLVHKNLMYKSPIKKNYEHVIVISFN